jgi:hypothetical protein
LNEGQVPGADDATKSVRDALVIGPRTAMVDQARDSALGRQDAAAQLNTFLDAAIRNGNPDAFYALLDRILDPQRVPLSVFRDIVKAAGGEQAFVGRIEAFLAAYGDSRTELVGLMSGKGTIRMRIKQRLGGDQPLVLGDRAGADDPSAMGVADLAGIARDVGPAALGGLAAMGVAGPLAPALVGGVSFYVLKPYLDEVFTTAHSYYQDIAKELADSDNVLLATLLGSLDDILIPGSAVEAALMFLPVGKIGVLLKPLLLRAAEAVGIRLAAEGLARLVQPLVRFVEALVETHVTPYLLDFERTLTVAIQQGKKEALAKALRLLEVAGQWLSSETNLTDLVRAARRPGAKTLSEAKKKEAEDLLTNLDVFRPPKGSATVSFSVDEHGVVVQTIRTTLQKNMVGRTEERLANIAAQLQLVAEEGQHWAHIAANRLKGDDQLYNLVRAEARVNMSNMHPYDVLRPGTQVEIKIVFDSVETTLTRYATSISYSSVSDGKSLGSLVELYRRPPTTLAAMKREAWALIVELKGEIDDPKIAAAVNRLAQFVTLSK